MTWLSKYKSCRHRRRRGCVDWTETTLQCTLLQANRVVQKIDSWSVIIVVASATGPIVPELVCMLLVQSDLEVRYFVHGVIEPWEFARRRCWIFE